MVLVPLVMGNVMALSLQSCTMSSELKGPYYNHKNLKLREGRSHYSHIHLCWGPGSEAVQALALHSQGCSAHSSHRQHDGLLQSLAAGCLPGNHKKQEVMRLTGPRYKSCMSINKQTVTEG